MSNIEFTGKGWSPFNDWDDIERACDFRVNSYSARPIEDAVHALGGKRFLVSWLGMPAVDAYDALGDRYFISLHREPDKLRDADNTGWRHSGHNEVLHAILNIL